MSTAEQVATAWAGQKGGIGPLAREAGAIDQDDQDDGIRDPEGGLIDATWIVWTELARVVGAMSRARAHACEADDYRVDPSDIDRLERLATALNTATAVYRARREMP